MSSWKVFGDLSQSEDGDNITNEGVCLSQMCSTDIAWDKVTIKWEYDFARQGMLLELDPWYITFDAVDSRIYLSRYIAGNYLEAWDCDFNHADKAQIAIVATRNEIFIEICGQRFSYAAASSTRMTFARLRFPKGARFSQLSFDATEIVEPHADLLKVVGKHSLPIEFTVDFYDDMLLTTFDRGKLDKMFELMTNFGSRRAYWIDHGKRDIGFWDKSAIPGALKNIHGTFDLLGDDLLAAAVVSSHKSDVELVGILKPYDTAICNITAPVYDDKQQCDALGGKLVNTYNFTSSHPGLCMRRRMIPSRPAGIGKIVITSRNAISQSLANEIKIYVSEDNATYQLYDGSVNIASTANEIILDALNISSKFVVLKMPKELAVTIRDTMKKMVHVFTPDNEEVEFTYGLVERRELKPGFHLGRKIEHLDFVSHGLNFDNAGEGIPSSLWNSRKTMLEIFAPEANQNIIGLAMDVNPVVPAMLSEAEPAAHEYWLERIVQMLDAGVDAIEIRLMNHGNIMDWSQYGFNDPVVLEYYKRWGVDITKTEYDVAEFQKLRGEFFTDFLKKASELTRSRGKKFRMHVEDLFQGSPDEPCPMGIHMPWRKWIDEKICDGISMKPLNALSHATAFGRDLVAACKRNGIEVNYTPFFHAFAGVQNQGELLDALQAMPFDAFNVYEFATIYKFADDGSTRPVNEDYIKWLNSLSFAVL